MDEVETPVSCEAADDNGKANPAVAEVGDGDGVLLLEIFRIRSLGVSSFPGSGVRDVGREFCLRSFSGSSST